MLGGVLKMDASLSYCYISTMDCFKAEYISTIMLSKSLQKYIRINKTSAFAQYTW